MTYSRITTVSLCAIGTMALGFLSGPPLSGQAPAAAPAPAGQAADAPPRGARGGPPMIDANNLRMHAEDRNPNGTVQVFGSQQAEGYYIVGQYFGPRQSSRPHFHDKDRWVTVVSGTWYTGEGDVFRPETMVPLKPGSVMYHPAGWHHYDGSITDEPVQLLIAGYGPVTTTQTEVDAQGNPVRRGGGAARGTQGPGAAAPPAGQ